MNLYSLLEQNFPQDRSAIAIETHDGLLYTWDDLTRATSKLANLLISLNLPQGSRVAAMVEKSAEALFLYLATLKAGLVYLPLNSAYQSAEIGYFFGNAQPAVVVCGSKNFSWVSKIAAQCGSQHVFTLDENRQGTLLARASGYSDLSKTVAREDGDLAAIIYTSGTTGRSKGAMLTHRNLASNAQVLKTYWAWQRDDVLLHALPIFHVHGLFVACHGALLNGSKMIWLPKLDLDQLIKHIPRSTVMMGVPTFYVRLLGDARFNAHLCRNMRLFICGSAPLLTETFNEFKQRSGHTILERYGMSETNMLVSNPYQGRRVAGSVGLPLPGTEVRLVDDAGAVCGQVNNKGEIGNVQVRGPNVFKGYWRMPEKTREEFTQDGWFKTGDLGRWGSVKGEAAHSESIPDDYLCIVGRSKDLIITGGYNVYPKEIEDLVDDLPGVAESAVVGVPHKDFGEVVVAVVVPKSGASLDAQKIIAELKTKIANYKVPKRVEIVTELPRNAMGKVQKNLLREKIKAA